MTRVDQSRALAGVISDTHGHLDPRVADVFAGVDQIIHAGDIGSVQVLMDLESIAPVTAVLGNTDSEIPGYPLAPTAQLTLGGVLVYVTHDASVRSAAQLPSGVDVAVSGHTHVPSAKTVGGILYLNPGAAYRSRLPRGERTVALLEVRDGRASARIVHL